MASSYEGLFEEWEVAVARKLCSQFVTRHAWLRSLEVDDLMQECLLHWYRVRGSYKPGRGSSAKTYMGRVLRHLLHDVLDQQLTLKRRGSHLSASLDETLSEGVGAEGEVSAEEADLSLRIDLERALEKLSPLQQRICELLKQGYPASEISRNLGRGRASIYDEIGQVRKVFCDEGLTEYLD